MTAETAVAIIGDAPIALALKANPSLLNRLRARFHIDPESLELKALKKSLAKKIELAQGHEQFGTLKGDHKYRLLYIEAQQEIADFSRRWNHKDFWPQMQLEIPALAYLEAMTESKNNDQMKTIIGSSLVGAFGLVILVSACQLVHFAIVHTGESFVQWVIR